MSAPEPGAVPQPSLPPRKALIGIAALVLFAGAVAADRFAPARGAAPPQVSPLHPGGVLACPFLGAGTGRSWVHVANAGRVTSKVTITTARQGAGPLTRTFAVPAGRAVTHALDAAVRQPSGAIVSYAGGEIIASRTSVLVTSEGNRGAVGGPCAPAGARTLVSATGSTLNADTTLYLLNPSSADAVAGVTFIAAGLQTEPEGLRSIVVSRRSVRRVRVGDFVFDQRSVASIVRVRTGVLAVDAVLSSSRGITLTAAREPGALLAGVGAADAGGAFVDVTPTGETDSVVGASLLTAEGQSAFASMPQSIEALTPQNVPAGPDRSPALGAVVQLGDGSPLAGGYRWIVQLANGRGDVAGIALAPPGRRMAAVTGEPAGGAHTRLLLANPSQVPVRARILLLTPSGPGQPQEATLEPGASLKLGVGSGKGPIGVVVESSGPVTAVLGSTVAPREVYAFAIEALPSRPDRPVGVEADPRLGVPAP